MFSYALIYGNAFKFEMSQRIYMYCIRIERNLRNKLYISHSLNQIISHSQSGVFLYPLANVNTFRDEDIYIYKSKHVEEW